MTVRPHDHVRLLCSLAVRTFMATQLDNLLLYVHEYGGTSMRVCPKPSMLGTLT